jgi:hypothetical protein
LACHAGQPHLRMQAWWICVTPSPYPQIEALSKRSLSAINQ